MSAPHGTAPPSAEDQTQALQRLQAANLLLVQGMRAVLQACRELPDARRPLHEVLRLGEQQAMRTLQATEAALAELHALRADPGDRPDAQRLLRMEQQLQAIRAAQQGQDLAGQQLNKAMALLQALESRIQDGIGPDWRRGCGAAVTRRPHTPDEPFDAQRLDQDSVDQLLAGLGN